MNSREHHRQHQQRFSSRPDSTASSSILHQSSSIPMTPLHHHEQQHAHVHESSQKAMSMSQQILRSKPKTVLEELEEQMKLLKWHKLANESALQTALIRTRQMKRQDAASIGAPGGGENHLLTRFQEYERREKKERILKAIEDEESKPLEVSKEFIEKYQIQESSHKSKLKEQIERQIKMLENVKCFMEQRKQAYFRKEDCKRIQQEYREQQTQDHNLYLLDQGQRVNKKNVKIKKKGNSDSPSNNQLVLHTKPENDSELENNEETQEKSEEEELSTILTTLDSLVQLERRVRSLEQHYDERHKRIWPLRDRIQNQSRQTAAINQKTNPRLQRQPSASASSRLLFSRQRTNPIKPGYPSLPCYTARLSSASSSTVNIRSSSVNTRLKSARTFLTETKMRKNSGRNHSAPLKPIHNQDIHNKRNSIPRSRISSSASMKNNGTRQRISSSSRTRGSHLGIKTSNPHLQDFYQMRDAHARRKENIIRKEETPKKNSLLNQISSIHSQQKRSNTTSNNIRRGSSSLLNSSQQHGSTRKSSARNTSRSVSASTSSSSRLIPKTAPSVSMMSGRSRQQHYPTKPTSSNRHHVQNNNNNKVRQHTKKQHQLPSIMRQVKSANNLKIHAPKLNNSRSYHKTPASNAMNSRETPKLRKNIPAFLLVNTSPLNNKT